MAENIFFELSIVLAIATFASMFMKSIKQPLIIGYIISGIIAGPFVLDILGYAETLQIFSQLGVAFLLFIVGLNLNIKNVKEVGFISLVGGIAQIVLTFGLGYMFSYLLGFSHIVSMYTGIGLSFSSTIIAVKILSDKREIDTFHGRIIMGILLLQDLAAAFILVFMASGFSGGSASDMIIFTTAKFLGIVVLMLFVSKYFLKGVLRFIATSQELLFLFGISWVFLVSLLLTRIGFSIEIGALFAGISMASSPFSIEIGNKLKPLRDFFITLFFILLGSQLVITMTSGLILKIIVLSAFVLLIKPLVIMAIMGSLGYKKRVGFLTGISLAQISEFSLIILFVGMNLGHVTQETISLVTFVGLISIAGSTYLKMKSDRLYRQLSPFLGIFERKTLKEEFYAKNDDNFEIMLFGYNRIGFSLVRSFKKMKKNFLVVDYDPEIISLMMKEKIPYRYGDVSDPELLDELDFRNVRLVVSTIPHLESSLLIIEKVKSSNKKTVVVMTSHQIDEAFKLYEAGANYVILPHFLGGVHASVLIEKFGTDMKKFVSEKIRHIGELNERKTVGHEHPKQS